MAGSWEQGDEPWGSIKCVELFFLTMELLASEEGLCFVELVGLSIQPLTVEMLPEMFVGLGPWSF